MIMPLCVLLTAAQPPYGDYIGDPARPAAPRGAAAEPSPKPAPLPAPPPPPVTAREAGRRVPGAAPPAGKRWYALTSHPGFEGYGALNARGEVVVEWHRRAGAREAVAGPAPGVRGAAPSAPACANGQCPAQAYPYPYRRGLFPTR
jgi:hypothetical protein